MVLHLKRLPKLAALPVLGRLLPCILSIAACQHSFSSFPVTSFCFSCLKPLLPSLFLYLHHLQAMLMLFFCHLQTPCTSLVRASLSHLTSSPSKREHWPGSGDLHSKYIQWSIFQIKCLFFHTCCVRVRSVNSDLCSSTAPSVDDPAWFSSLVTVDDPAWFSSLVTIDLVSGTCPLVLAVEASFSSSTAFYVERPGDKKILNSEYYRKIQHYWTFISPP